MVRELPEAFTTYNIQYKPSGISSAVVNDSTGLKFVKLQTISLELKFKKKDNIYS